MKHKNFTLGGFCPGGLLWGFYPGFFVGGICPGGVVLEPLDVRLLFPGL